MGYFCPPGSGSGSSDLTESGFNTDPDPKPRQPVTIVPAQDCLKDCLIFVLLKFKFVTSDEVTSKITVPGLLGLYWAPDEAALLLDVLHGQQGGVFLLSLLRYASKGINILWTGTSLYAPYSLLLISNKFWMGGGGGEDGESVGEKRGGRVGGRE